MKDQARKQTGFVLYSIFIVILICVAVFARLYVDMTKESNKVIETIGTRYMAGVTNQLSGHFETLVDLRLTQLDNLVETVPPSEYERNPIIGTRTLTETGKMQGFTYLALVDREGLTKVLYGEELEIADKESFLEALNAEESKVTVGENAAGDKLIIAGISVSYPMGEETEGTALIGGVPAEDYIDILDMEEDGDKIYSFIVRSDGGYVIRTKSVEKNNYFTRIENLYETNENSGKKAEEYITEIRQAMENREDYSAEFYIYGGERRLLYMKPLPECDWFLLTFMPYGILNKTVDEFSDSWLSLALGSCIIILSALLFIFLAYYLMARQQMEELNKARAQVEESLKEAEQANNAKTVFLNSMSHDIRTPMNAIMGYAKLATTHVSDRQKVLEYLEKIGTAGSHLLSLINDVLDMSRIESGKVQIVEEDVNLLELLSEIENIVQSDIGQKQMHATFGSTEVSDPQVKADKLRLSQVLLNCISNAIKYTPEGGNINVNLSQEPSDQKGYACYVFSVEDNGIGMSEEFVNRIFEPFSREETATVSGIQGTGLGMSITKNIVDMMGGRIWVESKKDAGTKVSVRLSLLVSEDKARSTNDEADLSESETNENISAFKDLKILLVEDNEFNREIATEFLEERGAIIDTAEDGQIAVEKIVNEPREKYDLILMDIQMPVMDGYEATRKIRALDDKDKAAIPIFAMTANAFDEDKKLALEAGMQEHITKPINIEMVERAIREHLKS